MNFTDMEYANRKHKTKRDEFLEIMDDVIPWDEWSCQDNCVNSYQ